MMLSVLGLGFNGASVAGATGVTTEFYLSLGASVSVGVQPFPVTPRGGRTLHGFANDLGSLAIDHGVSLQLTKLGCPGESAQTMIHGGGRCHYAGGTQLSSAVRFLKSHHNDRGIVTLEIGFNDVRTCLTNAGANAPCVSAAGTILTGQIERIMTRLRMVAGPDVTFVGVTLYNPFLASAITGSSSAAFVAGSVSAIDQVNSALLAGYTATSTTVIDIAKAFSMNDTTAVLDPTWGTIPTNAEQVCSLTWMCQPRPFGPNIHPNDHGYQVMAKAIADRVFR